jgi:hypothetical protein
MGQRCCPLTSTAPTTPPSVGACGTGLSCKTGGALTYSCLP